MSLSAHRKVVTVLFCDVVGSTALGESVDPEALQGLLARYFERMKGIVESHGGSVEKFIGDAVMAVFGVPVLHEDDALRACRAAVEMRDALPELGVEGRIGVNTGEVLTGTEERLATGDAVNVAARLEQAAEAGEVLLGAQTLRLVAAAVEVGEERLLELKGKSEPVAAHPLLAVQEAPERSHASRFIGRERELAKLVDAWERALAGPGCQLVTVVGDAGVGKSRLVAEALDSFDARVVRGRCLPYGEGITYWPVIEVVKQLAALPSDPAAAVAVRSLLGESDQGTSADQIAWAFRKLLVEQAPLVVVFDDIQWGEETFLDLVEAAALLTGDAPILLLCMARPELLERHPAWPGTLRLEPLSDDEADQLIREEVTGELHERIAHAAGGNPLFISEMLAMAREQEDVEVPPTLKALLAARLDRLDESERRVLERGSIEGELFHRGGVQALAPEETQVTARLTALVRRELVRPDRAQLSGDDGFRFRHLLIRDAAYDSLPKSVRAELHERFADWLVSHTELVELDEIVGYHLEQAVGYRRELGKPVEELAERAAERLAASGRRALWREDRRAARVLFERALELTRPFRLDVLLEVDLAATLFIEDSRRAAEIVEAAAERAAAEGDATGEVFARAMFGYHWFNLNECTADELEMLAAESVAAARAGGGARRARVCVGGLRNLCHKRTPTMGGLGPGEQAGVGAREARGPATDGSLLDRARTRSRADSGRRGAGAARRVAARDAHPVLAGCAGLAPGDARPLRRSRPARPGVERAPARARRPPDRGDSIGRDRAHGRRSPSGGGSPPDPVRLARGARAIRSPRNVRVPARPRALRPRSLRRSRTSRPPRTRAHHR